MTSERDVVGGTALGLSVVIAVVAYGRLPERMAVHWTAGGRPDGWLPAPLALAVFPVVIALTWGLFVFDVDVDPLGRNIRAFQRYHDEFAAALLAFLGYCQVLLVVWNLGYEFGPVRAIAPPMAALYYVTGRTFGNAERNWILGVRTPWTLSSEAVWRRTHEAVAPLYKLAAPVTLLAVAVPRPYALAVLVGPPVAVAVGGVVYSYVLYRRLESRGRGPGDGPRGRDA